MEKDPLIISAVESSQLKHSFLSLAVLALEKRGTLIPNCLGMKCLIFVDDLNMPSYDDSMAQPAIELLR